MSSSVLCHITFNVSIRLLRWDKENMFDWVCDSDVGDISFSPTVSHLNQMNAALSGRRNCLINRSVFISLGEQGVHTRLTVCDGWSNGRLMSRTRYWRHSSACGIITNGWMESPNIKHLWGTCYLGVWLRLSALCRHDKWIIISHRSHSPHGAPFCSRGVWFSLLSEHNSTWWDLGSPGKTNDL